MSNIQTRHTVESLFALKLEMLREMGEMFSIERTLSSQFESIGWHSPYRIESSFRIYVENRNEKAVDQAMWRYLVRLFNLEKYMLCTDWAKMTKEIDECQTPDFTIENANVWIFGLKELIRENVKTLIQKVYSEIVNGVYYVGGGYNAEKKKRNNNGIDAHFILRTCDYQSIFAYWRDTPSIMDDLEKVCYLLDGKALPEKTLRDTMRRDRMPEASNEYMTVKLCKNGNTHFTVTEKIRNDLNRFGPTGSVLGENIKIKVFD